MAACEVHHVVEGPAGAPVLVLANSLGSTTTIWDALVPRLAPYLRVVRYDLRGHGRSPVPPGPYTLADLGEDVVALLDRLGVERASICGISLGGMTGMWLAANAPERVDRLVAMCTSAMLAEEHDWPARAKLVREQGTGAVAQASIERWFTPGFVAANPDTVARLRATLADTPPEGYAGCCDAIAGMDLLDAIESVQAPTLVIAGRQDPATPPAHAERIAERIHGSRLELVDAAHLANIELADSVTALTLAHLEGR